MQFAIAFIGIFLWIYFARNDPTWKRDADDFGAAGTNLVIDFIMFVLAFLATHSLVAFLVPILGGAGALISYFSGVGIRNGYRALETAHEAREKRIKEEKQKREAENAERQNPTFVRTYAEERLKRVREILGGERAHRYEPQFARLIKTLEKLQSYRDVLEGHAGSGPSTPANDVAINYAGEHYAKKLKEKLEEVKTLVHDIYDIASRLPDRARGEVALGDKDALPNLLNHIDSRIKAALPRHLLEELEYPEEPPSGMILEAIAEHMPAVEQDVDTDDELVERELAELRRQQRQTVGTKQS